MHQHTGEAFVHRFETDAQEADGALLSITLRREAHGRETEQIQRIEASGTWLHLKSHVQSAVIDGVL